MRNNFFINAYKFVETEESSQLENFSTEAFVFVLRHLINETPKTAQRLISLFGFKDITLDELKELQIETQRTFFAPENFTDKKLIPHEQQEARPDIAIWLEPNDIVFIEVKVDAELNIYTLENHTQIDQVDFYRNIKSCRDVYTLSKHRINKDYPTDKLVRWHTIFEELKSLDSFVTQEFLHFLESNNMGERIKVSDKALNILEQIKALNALLKNSWESANMQGFKLNAYNYANENGLGYYILKESDNNSATKEFEYFIGINLVTEHKESYLNKITFWTSSKSVRNKSKDCFDAFRCGYITRNNIELSELTALETIDEQENMIKNWLIDEIYPLLK